MTKSYWECFTTWWNNNSPPETQVDYIGVATYSAAWNPPKCQWCDSDRTLFMSGVLATGGNYAYVCQECGRITLRW